jgi:hypothetical protein
MQHTVALKPEPRLGGSQMIGAEHVLSRHVIIHHIDVTGHVHEEIEETVQAQAEVPNHN